jgi:hypothetical protein
MCLNEAYIKFHAGKHLSDAFPIQDGLEQTDALSPLLFNTSLEYVVGNVQENKGGSPILVMLIYCTRPEL